MFYLVLGWVTRIIVGVSSRSIALALVWISSKIVRGGGGGGGGGSLISRLSFSNGRREPGSVGGVEPWTSAARILAVPIRLQNKSREHVTIL